MKLLKINIITIILPVIFSMQVNGQGKKGFEVSGHLEGVHEGTVAKLINRFADWHTFTIMDSCKVVNGNFHLTGSLVPEGPRMYGVYLVKGDVYLPKSSLYGIFLFVNNGDKLIINGDIDQPKNIKITGSLLTDAHKWAEKVADQAGNYNYRGTKLLAKIKDSIGYDKNLVGQAVGVMQRMDGYLDSVTKNVPKGYEASVPTLISQLSDYHNAILKELYKSMPKELKDSYDGKLAKIIASVSVGQVFPAFLLPDSAGKKINLKDILIKGEITIVHFWGSNSVDVDIYQKELKYYYKKYHAKGLNVIGVSADTVLPKWKQKLDLEEYPWLNVVADPKGWKKGSLINDVYNEGGHDIPNTTNVLLDNKGTILAWDVNGILLQYYLDKYLSN